MLAELGQPGPGAILLKGSDEMQQAPEKRLLLLEVLRIGHRICYGGIFALND